MAYGSAMNLNQMGVYTAVGGNYGTFPAAYPANPFRANQMAAGPAKMVGMLMQLLQSFAQLQNSWSQTLGSPFQRPTAYQPDYQVPTYLLLPAVLLKSLTWQNAMPSN